MIVVVLASALVLQSVVFGVLACRMVQELHVSHAAALQANNLPDAARRLTKVDEEKRVSAQLRLQEELRASGGVFPDSVVHKPDGI